MAVWPTPSQMVTGAPQVPSAARIAPISLLLSSLQTAAAMPCGPTATLTELESMLSLVESLSGAPQWPVASRLATWMEAGPGRLNPNGGTPGIVTYSLQPATAPSSPAA